MLFCVVLCCCGLCCVVLCDCDIAHPTHLVISFFISVQTPSPAHEIVGLVAVRGRLG